MAELIELPGARPVNEGERRVAHTLAERLPDGYVVIPNLEVREVEKPRYHECDVIVVAPHAVYVVEVKYWNRAEIVGDARTWTVNRRSQRNPVRLTATKAKAIKSVVVRARPALNNLPVQEAVVLAHRPVHVDLRGDGDDFLFVDVDSLIDFVLDPSALPRPPLVVDELVDRVTSVLAAAEVAGADSHRRVGSWELGEVVDQTDNSVTYRAVDTRTNLRGALVRLVHISPYLYGKGPVEDRIAEVRRDFVALRKMGPHPNIVGTVDTFEDDHGNEVVVTDEVEGANLRLYLRDQRLSEADRLRIVQGLTQALAHAHRSGVIHRRVAADNVIMRTDRHPAEPMLVNFDFARILEAGTTIKPGSPLDVDPGYVAPEVFDPTLGPATEATDWFGLACIIWRLWEGEPPFTGSPAGRQFPVPAPSHLPGALFAATTGFLQRRPDERTGSLDQVLAACEQLSANRASDPNLLKTGTVINDSLIILEHLGAGSSADVYRARDPLWGDVALKVFHDHIDYSDVQREFTALRDTEHPNIIRVIHHGSTDTQPPRPFILMKIADGVALSVYATNAGRRLDPTRVVSIGRQLLSALSAIHRDPGTWSDRLASDDAQLAGRPIIHRDIKPENVFIGADDHVTLIDFNIATRAGADKLSIAGTPGYQPPDSTGDVWDVDVDLFATGVVLYQLACGRHPYADARPSAANFRSAGTAGADLSPSFVAFLDRACSPHRADRFDSDDEMLAALDRVAVSTTPLDRPSTTWEKRSEIRVDLPIRPDRPSPPQEADDSSEDDVVEQPAHIEDEVVTAIARWATADASADPDVFSDGDDVAERLRVDAPYVAALFTQVRRWCEEDRSAVTDLSFAPPDRSPDVVRETVMFDHLLARLDASSRYLEASLEDVGRQALWQVTDEGRSYVAAVLDKLELAQILYEPQARLQRLPELYGEPGDFRNGGSLGSLVRNAEARISAACRHLNAALWGGRDSAAAAAKHELFVGLVWPLASMALVALFLAYAALQYGFSDALVALAACIASMAAFAVGARTHLDAQVERLGRQAASGAFRAAAPWGFDRLRYDSDAVREAADDAVGGPLRFQAPFLPEFATDLDPRGDGEEFRALFWLTAWVAEAVVVIAAVLLSFTHLSDGVAALAGWFVIFVCVSWVPVTFGLGLWREELVRRELELFLTRYPMPDA